MSAGLTDKQVQAKLDQIAALARELSEEGHRRYGVSIDLFACDGTLYMMSGDTDGDSAERRQFIQFHNSKGHCPISGGGW